MAAAFWCPKTCEEREVQLVIIFSEITLFVRVAAPLGHRFEVGDVQASFDRSQTGGRGHSYGILLVTGANDTFRL